ncbi:MAG: hypothetical protein HRT58_22355 [Crocinitomicaceae bacterium]|nr:hypothetical protein [Flavobacteriales bacterium]NQZ38420.1 hypothetical protein [Crocinitomicaceae bacterium]
MPRRNYNDRTYANDIEQQTRQQIPRAGNQIEDLLADPGTLARHELTRYMETVLGVSPSANGILDTLGTSASACRYHGGMCNEYSAVSFGLHMGRQEVSGEPITRYWNPNMKHSFTTIGDERDPAMPRFIADGWTMDRDPLEASQTIMQQGQNNVVAQWTDRMPFEGYWRVNQDLQTFSTRLKEKEQNSLVKTQASKLVEENRLAQQRLLVSPSPDWVWNHRTNRYTPPESSNPFGELIAE